ncbi:MAG: hypothetical protein GY798_28950 [Hyphomicrobiales bacterium]|nr:hypothetical protein [Hyphomicrobiales bacterium]
MASNPADPTPARWSLDDACTGWFAAHGDEPRNLYTKSPDFMRQYYDLDLANAILDFTPPNSNDYLLQDDLEWLIARMDPTWEADIRAVFVGRSESLEPNAEAWSPSERARVVSVFVGVGTALAGYAVVSRVLTMALAEGAKHSSSTDELFAGIRERFDQIAQANAIEPILASRRRWRAEGNVDPSDEAMRAIESWGERLPGDDALAVNRLLGFGQRFFVAHELGHHLLGHTHAATFEGDAFPALLALTRARADLHLHDTESWTYDEQCELDADDFALLALAGWFGSYGSDYSGWLQATFGSLLALPVLEDLARASGIKHDTARMTGDGHPPLTSRIERLEALIGHMPSELQEDHPPLLDYIDQVRVLREFLETVAA